MAHSISRDAIPDMSATDLAAAVRAQDLSATDIVEAYLARIEAREADIQAFAYISPDHCRAQAKALDEARAAGTPIGPLFGLPVGIKDIIETGDQPTEHGSEYFVGHQPEHDAVCVAQLKAAGAIIMGKTVTTELATRRPGKTRNPHNLEHTPGGSSSGSAAAVAAGMVPLALGTQTGGSVIRPASFCGIHGLKPTRGLISRSGVLMQSHTLDTIGVYARSLDDIALITGVLDCADPSDDVSYDRAPSSIATTAVTDRFATATPRIGFIKTPAWDKADEGARAAITQFVDGLGAACEEFTPPAEFDVISRRHVTVQHGENQYHFAPLIERDPSLMSDTLRAIVTDTSILAKHYQAALMAREPLYGIIAEALDRYDGLVALSSTGPAPRGLDWTGDPIFNGLWTYIGVPTVSLPKLTVDGLPCGVTVIGKRREERKLLETAAWIEANGAPVSV